MHTSDCPSECSEGSPIAYTADTGPGTMRYTRVAPRAPLDSQQSTDMDASQPTRRGMYEEQNTCPNVSFTSDGSLCTQGGAQTAHSYAGNQDEDQTRLVRRPTTRKPKTTMPTTTTHCHLTPCSSPQPLRQSVRGAPICARGTSGRHPPYARLIPQ